MKGVRIHRYAAGPQGVHVNAYLVETGAGVIAIDGTLTVSDGQALRRQIDALAKPLLGVLLTHAHPDHYGGIIQLAPDDDTPVYATAAVATAVRRDDDVKDAILRPMFGAEWALRRRFPDREVADGQELALGGALFTVIDLGPGESPADSVWFLGDDRRTAFIGDQVYDRTHAYLADGHYQEWLANLERLRAELPDDARLHVGHGDVVTPAAFARQRDYIEAFVQAVADADWSDSDAARSAVLSAMHRALPADELRFLMELSIEPVASRMGLLPLQPEAPG